MKQVFILKMMNHAWLDLIFIDFIPAELKYYAFMFSLDKCSGSYNVLPPKIFVPKRKRQKC